MKYTIALAAILAASTAYADAPVGSASLPCNIDAWTPIMSADGATVLYWNNATCVKPERDLPDEPKSE
jgi:hypothetical protein